MKNTSKSTKTTTKKTAPKASANRSHNANGCPAADAPIPWVPTETPRVPLAPLSGEVAAVRAARCKGGDVDDDLEAERVALRSSGAFDQFALVDSLMLGLTGCDEIESPLQFATEALEDIGAEMRVLSTAIGAHDTDLWPLQATADRVARRAELIADLARRIETARKPPAHRAAPPAHEVAGNLLTLPGVLTGAPDAWERLQRICERLDVAIVDDPERFDLGSIYTVWPRVKGGPNLPCIVVARGADRVDAVSHLLGHAVAKRDGYEVSPEWCNELAAFLVPEFVAKGAA